MKDLNTITGYNWETGHIELEFEGSFGYEFKPIEVHLKEDGAIGDKPSMCIVMYNQEIDRYVFGQLSVEMWNKGLAEIGYEIRKL